MAEKTWPWNGYAHIEILDHNMSSQATGISMSYRYAVEQWLSHEAARRRSNVRDPTK
jgi:hypothetical protein